MQFLYFAHNADAVEGIDYAFESKPASRGSTGPDGRGFLLFDQKTFGSLSKAVYSEREQTWRKVPNSNAWVGYWDDSPQRPDDLKRSEQIAGHNVRLGDDNQWTVPICRSYLPDEQRFSVALPQSMDMDDGGQWIIGDVVKKHQALWKASEGWFDFIAQSQFATGDEDDSEPVVILVSDVADACVTVLGANYRISGIEMAMLGLLTSHGRAEIMNATIDFPTLADHLKKKEIAEPSGTSLGSPGTIPVTVPA